MAQTRQEAAKRWFGAVGVASGCALALLGGCAGFTEPKFSVERVQVVEQTPEGAVLLFSLAGENRNPDPVPLREVRYELWLDGEKVFEGRRSAQLTLNRYGEQTLVLPVATPLEPDSPVLTGVTPYRFSGTVEYERPGAISETLFENNLIRPKAGFSESGRLNFIEGPMQ